MDIKGVASHDVGSIIRQLKAKKSVFFTREREKRSLRLFKEVARRVPAYKDFLRKHRVDPSKIKTYKDFGNLPLTSKKDYLKKYPLEKLSWDGTLKKPLVFTSTSGSTGDPFYFPRGKELDWQYSVLIQEYLSQSTRSSSGPVLVIIGFGMGVWIGGIITYKAFEIAAQNNNLPVSIITPGINKGEIFHALRNLSPQYKETILVGYPPFVKDIIDEAPTQGINLKKLNLRLLFAAEAFNEKFRDYLVKKTGIKNSHLDTLNIYGTADIGAMAYETPLSILIRRLAIKNKQIFKDLFGDITKTPTLAQYNPFFMNFEAPGGEIVLTGNNTIPLIRYAIGDHGGVATFDEINEKLVANKISLAKEAKTAGINNKIYQKPFVYVYERSDLSTTLYGLQIYPEVIREVLLDDPHGKYLTGKFSMMTKFDKKHNQYLEINLELKKGKKQSTRIKKHLNNVIVLNLRSKISEFKELNNFLGKRAHPKIVFWPHEHPKHFKPGIKQKWVKK